MDETLFLAWKDLEQIIKETEYGAEEKLNCQCRHSNVIFNPSDKADICLDCGQILKMDGDSCEAKFNFSSQS